MSSGKWGDSDQFRGDKEQPSKFRSKDGSRLINRFYKNRVYSNSKVELKL
jgi:hypothetical protein